jgi:hypothetical protein
MNVNENRQPQPPEQIGSHAFVLPPPGRMFFPPTSMYWRGDRQATLGQPPKPPPVSYKREDGPPRLIP